MSNNRPTRRKAAAPATTALATTPSVPKFQCAKVGKTFRLGDYYCQLLKPTGPNDRSINTATLITRGRDAGANMGDEAVELFNKHRREIPAVLNDKRLAFPESMSGDSRVRYLELDKKDRHWCMLLTPVQTTWDSDVVLVQLTFDMDSMLGDTAP